LEQKVIDALGVGLDIAAEAAEELADGRRGLARHVLEEHVIGVCNLDQEVSAAAAATLLVAAPERLHEHASGIGGDAKRRAQRLLTHGLDHGGPDRGADLLGPPAHRAAT